MAKVHTQYRIGTPGVAWTAAELAQWRAEQNVTKRDYFSDVVSPLLRTPFGRVFQYGELDYRPLGAARYPLFAVKTDGWSKERPLVVVTGGVHGYETSGIHGALRFVSHHMQSYTGKANVLVLPCVSPWGYETINRWTPNAVDPNRQFTPDAAPGCDEARQAMACVLAHAAESSGVLMHMDLHETTDTDNSEFTPAKAARDGEAPPKWYPIPDGFYLIGDEPRPQLEWHETMIAAVREVTHIAEPDENGTIVDEPVTKPGILILPAVGDCASFTPAKFTTTTEVYPDSKRTNPDECNRAQAACVVAGLEYALAHADL
eukprot:CAMPEP_0174828250 /NCGR_PEP_ID=MMETSP1114-20130205/1217_1 /TAXON_ID=312471 /ORGANISM="Neobodo designis, Strain CCAP 1951/1" /LENGTH=316 /DNA_ID=CAMNT_0016061963 /DNA_START=54 /DNA_END=1004 /DNA_ORIENTATION=-